MFLFLPVGVLGMVVMAQVEKHDYRYSDGDP